MHILSANRGLGLETTVIASQRNLIRVEKMHAGAKFIGKGKFIAIKGPVDFVGTVCATGRGINFDAKQCNLAKRFSIGRTETLKPAQREYLIRQGQANAIAGLLIESTHLRRFYWLDWRELLNHEASIAWTDPRLIDLGPATHLIDFGRVPGVNNNKLNELDTNRKGLSIYGD